MVKIFTLIVFNGSLLFQLLSRTMTSRRSRQKANESSVEDALAEMKRLKEQGKSRIDEFDESEEDIYEYLEDEDYSKHVAKERERAKRFIITTDSDTRDYVDDGEELWVQERERTEKENKPKRSNKKEEKQQTRNISSLLLKGSTKQSAPKKKEVYYFFYFPAKISIF